MKKYFREKYKLINVVLFLITLFVTLFIYSYVNNGNCLNNCSLEFKKGLLNPFFTTGKWLVVILGALLFFPAHIFKKWLFFIAPPILVLTFYLVRGISVYSGNPFNPTRAGMAENGMIVLAVVTAVFVLIQMYRTRTKK